MFSTPLIDSSIGVATVSAMTCGLAPGYCVRTTTEGGTTSGYSEIGNPRTAITPPRKISSESTPAKIGRSMKNFEKFMAFFRVARSRARRRRRHGIGLQGHRHRLRLDQRAGADPLQAVDDDPLLRLQA